jgi:endonuclease III
VDKKKAGMIYGILEKKYPEAVTALTHNNAFELLVATILSAQCTDERVNMVTRELFKKYKNARDLSMAGQSDLEKDIRSTGFYRNKAKNIRLAALKIEKEFNGAVPKTMEELVSLPGVARKTANIVLFHAFGKNEGIAVDTHVRRLSLRLGLSHKDDPVKIEKDLIELFDRKKWGYLTNILISHGRKVCRARKPLCGECSVSKLCPSAFKV